MASTPQSCSWKALGIESVLPEGQGTSFCPAMELDFVSQGTDWTLTSFRLESDVCLRKFPLQQVRETRAGIVLKFRQEVSVCAYTEKGPHSGHVEE